MITGVRLTQLANGEPILGASWSYKNLSGVDAVSKRLEDLFYNAKYMGFNFVIDTIKPEFGSDGKLTLTSIGEYGNVWTFDQRIAKYKELCLTLGINLFLEVEFPTAITDNNLNTYAQYFLNEIVSTYDWVKYWQVITKPDIRDSKGNYKCSPADYVKFMQFIYPKVKLWSNEIKLGGPGISDALDEYINNNHGWLADAIGENFGTNPSYDSIGDKGFLPYIDFFCIEGWQNTVGLNYNNFTNAMNILKLGIYNRIGDNNIRIYSTNQGWQASSTDSIALAEQGYYELREFLNCAKNEVYPFKCQLVDEYPDPSVYATSLDKTQLNYGLFNWYMGDDAQKPAYNEYLFLLKNLSAYNTLTNSPDIMEANSTVDYVTFTKTVNGQETTATVIWSKTYDTAKVVLNPQYNRQYLLPNGTQQVVDQSTEIILQNNHFLIVFEQVLATTAVDLAYLENAISRKLYHTEQTITNLLSLLTGSYPKEVRDTNTYKLLRSLSIEMADAKVDLEEIKDDLYIDYAKEQAIQNNFGVLVSLTKKSSWDWEKYRRLIKGVSKSLLSGPTHKSIVDAIQLFTNFNVNITELYKAGSNIDSSLLDSVDGQFAFIVEIEKPLDDVTAQEDVYTDTNYIVNIVKPAHTISIIIVTLSGKENYRKQYLTKNGIEYQDSDQCFNETSNVVNEGIYGWKHDSYNGEFSTVTGNPISNSTLTNGGMLIGPRYVLYDESAEHMNSGNADAFKNVIENIGYLLEIPEFDLYAGAKDSDLIELQSMHSEYKFGINIEQTLETNGGLSCLKVLNKFRLGYASKLRDNVVFEPDFFFDDKYVFRNTLRSLRFNKSPGLTGGTFGGIPDKAIVFDFETPEISFRKKVITLANGQESIIDRLSEDVSKIDLDYQLLYDTTKAGEKRLVQFDTVYDEDLSDPDDLIPWLKTNGPSFMSKKLGVKRARAQYSLGTEYYEKTEPVQEEPQNYAEFEPREYYRSITLGDEMYHIHKRITTISTGQNYFQVDSHDLFTHGDDTNESVTRVFVNGILRPSWLYEEVPSQFDVTRSQGIRFKGDIVFLGDQISIVYLNDRNIIVGDFPIIDEVTKELLFSHNDTYKVYQNVGNFFDTVLDYDGEIYKGAIEFISSLIVLPTVTEEFHEVKDSPEFAGSDYCDWTGWTQTSIEEVNRFVDNTSLLNHSFLASPAIDSLELGTIDSEFINVIKNVVDANITNVLTVDFSDVHNFDYYNKEKIPFPDAVEIEGPPYNEIDIRVNMNIVDNVPGIGMISFDQYIPVSDNMAITAASVNVNEKRFVIKEDRYYTDYTTGIFADIRDKSIVDKNSFGIETLDVRVNPINDTYIYQAQWLDTDKYIFTDDVPSHSVTFAPYTDTFNKSKIIDKAENGYTVSDIRTKPIGEFKACSICSILTCEEYNTKSVITVLEMDNGMQLDSHRLQSNLYSAFRLSPSSRAITGFNRTKFFTKSLIDIQRLSIETNDIIKTSEKAEAITAMANETVEHKYRIKEDNLSGEYTRSNNDEYALKRNSDGKPLNELADSNTENYSMKMAICYLELVRYRNGNIPEQIRIISLT